MYKELFDVQDAVREAVMSEDVRELASRIYFQYESMSDETMKKALFVYAGRVASVTAFELFRRLLTEDQLEQALEAIDDLMDIEESVAEEEE
jgi:hypothetical protein